MATRQPDDSAKMRSGGWRPRRGAVTRLALVATGIGLVAACGAAAGPSLSTIQAVPGADGAAFNGVASTPGGFVVAGRVPVSGEQSHAAAWTSTDGRTWTRAADDASFSGKVMQAVASGPAGLLAVGTNCWTGECGNNAIWTSTDGATWHPAADIAPRDGFDALTEAVVAGGPGWILAGREVPDAPGANLEPGIWTTTDGHAYSVANIAMPAGAADVAGAIAGVAVGGGKDVAVGTLQTDAGHGAAAWVSTDAQAWTAASDDGTFDGSVISGVIAGGPGFVAVGRDGSGAAVWTSKDGSSWTKEPAGPGFSDAQMTSVGTSGGRFLAAGYDANGALAWTSADGQTWAPVSTGPDAAGMQTIGAATNATVDVIVGGSTGNPRIWTAAP